MSPPLAGLWPGLEFGVTPTKFVTRQILLDFPIMARSDVEGSVGAAIGHDINGGNEELTAGSRYSRSFYSTQRMPTSLAAMGALKVRRDAGELRDAEDRRRPCGSEQLRGPRQLGQN